MLPLVCKSTYKLVGRLVFAYHDRSSKGGGSGYVWQTAFSIKTAVPPPVDILGYIFINLGFPKQYSSLVSNTPSVSHKSVLRFQPNTTKHLQPKPPPLQHHQLLPTSTMTKPIDHVWSTRPSHHLRRCHQRRYNIHPTHQLHLHPPLHPCPTFPLPPRPINLGNLGINPSSRPLKPQPPPQAPTVHPQVLGPRLATAVGRRRGHNPHRACTVLPTRHAHRG